jgi:hypothetical protein
METNTSMSERDQKIYEEIDEILYFDWNPIGDKELPRDEYQSYTPKIFNLKKLGSGCETIAQTLSELEFVILGQLGDIERCRTIAKRIEKI